MCHEAADASGGNIAKEIAGFQLMMYRFDTKL
jgi:hypothetical protein